MDVQNKNTASQKEAEKKRKRRWLLLLLLLLLLIISVVSCKFIGRGGNSTPDPTPTPLPPKSEVNAQPIEGDNNDTKLEAPEGGGAVSLTYAKEVTIDLSTQKATLVFGNPSQSNQDAIVQLVIQDTVILQSGSLAPGTQLTTLDLAEGAAERLSSGVYDGKFVVSFYDQPTGRWATLNAEIPVTVTVIK